MVDTTRVQSTGQDAQELTRLPHLADQILQFDLAEEAARLRQEDSWARGTGRSSRTLAKYPGFRVVLTLLKAGAQVDEHKTNLRISIQAVSGAIRLQLPDRNVELRTGQLLVLDSGVPHDVTALEESAFLLTLS